MSHQNRFPGTHTSHQPPRNLTPQSPPGQGGYQWTCNFCNSVFWSREQMEQHQFHCPEKTDTQTQLPYTQLAVRAHTPHRYPGAYDGTSQQSLPPPRGIYPYSTAAYSQRPLQHDPTHSAAAQFQHPVPDSMFRHPSPSQIQYPTPRASPGIDLQYPTSYPAVAVSSVSQPRDNLLEALRMLVEERKEEVKGVFLELRTELEQCEEGVNKELCELYSDTRERVERDEKKIGKLETAKGNLQTDLVDNEFNSILQTTMDNFDAQIAEIRRSSITIPRYVELEWNKEELKKSIERVCRIVSSNRDSRQSVQTSGVISHPYEEARVLTEQLKQTEAENLTKENKTTDCKSRLQKEAENDRNSKTQSNDEETALQRELEKFRSENAALYTERDSMFVEVQHFKSENEKLKHGLIPNRSNSAEQSKKKCDESEKHIQLLSQRITDLEIDMKKKDELIQLSYVEKEEFVRKCSLLETELNQFKSGVHIGNINESNVRTIQVKERLLDISSRKNQELKQQIEDLEMNVTLKETERQHLETVVRDLRKDKRTLENNSTFRDAESGDLRREVTRLRSELNKAQRLLASELNKKNEFVGVGQDEDDSIFSMSQNLGPEFKRGSVVSSDFDETGRQNVRKQQSSSDERENEELRKQVSELNRCVEEMKTELEFHRKENHSLKEKLNTSKRELEIVSNKLVQTEQNLSAVQTYLDEAHYKENEALNKTAEKNKDISASPTTPATHKKDDKSTTKQPKYKYKDILFGRKYTKAYTLNQVEEPVGHLGGIVLCNRRTQYTTEYVAGTLQAIIPPRYSHEKTIAGIEFVDPLGDCDGDGHFKSKPKHALFIATDVVYIPCKDPQ